MSYLKYMLFSLRPASMEMQAHDAWLRSSVRKITFTHTPP